MTPMGDIVDCFVPAGEVSDDPVWQALVKLAANRGVDVAVTDWAGRVRSPFDGYFTGPDLRLIVIDSRQPEEQMQEALAHELGHYCLRHRGLPLSQVLDAATDEELPPPLRSQESEANRFAGKLLALLRGQVARSCDA